jgi:D-alanyl-lipoteichoic acid acyltransferase DltB (MBOAT superfamily)
VNLGLLFAFKYFNFVAESLNYIFGPLGIQTTIPLIDVLLPVGISFYTFQTLAYTIDVYRKRIKPEKNIGHFALYVSFFPQLVAGPIERAQNLLPQFKIKTEFSEANLHSGLELILWGLVKKVVIANRLSIYVDEVYNNITLYSGPQIAVATVFFAFQIYCDFSGYTDIAIGTAKILGIDLMQNFKRPYLATSISNFWQRWHISLSSWFRDYLYIPMGGSWVGFPKVLINILVVFLVSGLWHGANWTFLAWGAFYGILMVIEYILKKSEFISNITQRHKKYFSGFVGKLIAITITFLLVNIGWVLFRANNISDAIYAYDMLFSEWSIKSVVIKNFDIKELSLSFVLILILFSFHIIQEKSKVEKLPIFRFKTQFVKNFFYVLLVVVLIFLGKSGDQFIYFQF